MIRHRPLGSGHPYSVDTEQRNPIDPIAREPLTIGARTTPDVERVDLELTVTPPGGAPATRTIPLARVARTSRGQTIDGGHLASAQARLARKAGGWAVTIDAPPAGSALRYRLVGSGADGRAHRTRWFETTVFGWRPAPDSAVASEGRSRVVPGSVSVLSDGGLVRRVRFALPLRPGEHVTGLGERYDALDHRGTSLDSVVFEQYKSQGAERKTYLPMPFGSGQAPSAGNSKSARRCGAPSAEAS